MTQYTYLSFLLLEFVIYCLPKRVSRRNKRRFTTKTHVDISTYPPTYICLYLGMKKHICICTHTHNLYPLSTLIQIMRNKVWRCLYFSVPGSHPFSPPTMFFTFSIKKTSKWCIPIVPATLGLYIPVEQGYRLSPRVWGCSELWLWHCTLA